MTGPVGNVGGMAAKLEAGALAAEAVVFFDPALASEFEYRRKRGGHLASKMRFLSAQLSAFVDKGLWLEKAARANALRKPVRWFSIPQLFRYERQQKGRLREHFQFNVDIFGEADVAADAMQAAFSMGTGSSCAIVSIEISS